MKNRLLPVLVFFVITSSLCHAQQTPILWGMTSDGGQLNKGMMFSLNTATDIETNVHNFTNGTDGYFPDGSFNQASNGLLYATTYRGGINDKGTLVSYNISTGVESLLYSFGSDTDGFFPNGSLIQASDSLLYGMTLYGGIYGSLQEEGVIFSYNIVTGTETVVHDFGGSGDGTAPDGSLLQVGDSLLYGLTSGGGTNREGVIFSYNIFTGVENILHDFGGTDDGLSPHGSLIQASNGLLYGVTYNGGNHNGGIIFSYNISTGIETDIYNFGASGDGNSPSSLLQATDTLLYGTAFGGGFYSYGMLFSYNISTGIETDIHDFGAGYDGIGPYGALIQASNVLLYGMTTTGGFYDEGTVYSYTISSGIENDIHDFSGPTADGVGPYGALLAIDSTIIFPTPVTSSICEGGSDTLSVTGATSYTWIPSAGLNTTIGSSVIASPSVTTTYTITGTVGSQTSTKNVTVTVIPPPSITVNASLLTICTGGTTTLTANGGVLYTWSPAAGLSSTVGSEVIADPSVTTTYTVTGINSNGCSATNSVVVTVLSASTPTITATPYPASYCVGGSSVITASGGNNYTWSPATGLSGTTGVSVTASPTATTVYTVTGTNLGGCSATNTVTVTVNPNPTITATPSPDSYCLGGDALLTGTGAGSGGSYTWSPATDLSATTGISVLANPTITTTYIVTGTNSGGCSATNTVTVTVNPSPTITASPNPSYCNGGSAALNAYGGITYTWSPATDLSATTGATVEAEPTITSTYVVTGSSFGCSATDTIIVTVDPVPTITASASPASYCTGGISTLSATGANMYIWSPSTNLDATTGAIVAANPTETTTYVVIGTNSSGCQGSYTVVVTVGTSATVTASATPSSYCENGNTTLSASGCQTYTWSPATALSDTTGANVTASPTVTTTYTIDGASGAGCTGTTTVIVTVNPNPTVTSKSATICIGDSVPLTVSGATTYTWFPSTGLSTTTGSSVVANPTATTIYLVTGTNLAGCSTSVPDTVFVNHGLITPVLTRQGNMLISTATQGNQWYLNDVAINGATNETYDVTAVGCYSVIATNLANGCSTKSDTLCISSISGVDQLSVINNQLSVYPNPTGGEVFINISLSVANLNDWNLQITDVLGRTLFTKQPLNYTNDIDLSNLPGGVYFITVINKTGRVVVPVVRE